MRLASMVLAMLGALAGATPALAQYTPNKWCAVYSGDIGAADNCGFVSQAQCQATVSGIGGFCQLNPFYPGNGKKLVRKRHRR